MQPEVQQLIKTLIDLVAVCKASYQLFEAWPSMSLSASVIVEPAF